MHCLYTEVYNHLLIIENVPDAISGEDEKGIQVRLQLAVQDLWLGRAANGGSHSIPK